MHTDRTRNSAGLLHRLTRIAGTTFLLALPIGYYPENPDSTEVMVGVHGGFGQAVTVLRDCSGNPYSSARSPYRDISASLYVRSLESPVVLGVRGGFVEIDAAYGGGRTTPWTSRRVNYSYVNPNLNLELDWVGVGVGYVSGHIPYSTDDFVEADPSEPHVSGHVRLGHIEKAYFMTSFGENTPLISGGSWFDIGVGYRASRRFRGFTGISAGMADDITFMQQGRIGVFRGLDADVTIRAGSSDGKFDGSVAAGLNYRFKLPSR